VTQAFHPSGRFWLANSQVIEQVKKANARHASD
jgi:hypothetical protein